MTCNHNIPKLQVCYNAFLNTWEIKENNTPIKSWIDWDIALRGFCNFPDFLQFATQYMCGHFDLFYTGRLAEERIAISCVDTFNRIRKKHNQFEVNFSFIPPSDTASAAMRLYRLDSLCQRNKVRIDYRTFKLIIYTDIDITPSVPELSFCHLEIITRPLKEGLINPQLPCIFLLKEHNNIDSVPIINKKEHNINESIIQLSSHSRGFHGFRCQCPIDITNYNNLSSLLEEHIDLFFYTHVLNKVLARYCQAAQSGRSDIVTCTEAINVAMFTPLPILSPPSSLRVGESYQFDSLPKNFFISSSDISLIDVSNNAVTGRGTLSDTERLCRRNDTSIGTAVITLRAEAQRDCIWKKQITVLPTRPARQFSFFHNGENITNLEILEGQVLEIEIHTIPPDADDISRLLTWSEDVERVRFISHWTLKEGRVRRRFFIQGISPTDNGQVTIIRGRTETGVENSLTVSVFPKQTGLEIRLPELRDNKHCALYTAYSFELALLGPRGVRSVDSDTIWWDGGKNIKIDLNTHKLTTCTPGKVIIVGQKGNFYGRRELQIIDPPKKDSTNHLKKILCYGCVIGCIFLLWRLLN